MSVAVEATKNKHFSTELPQHAESNYNEDKRLFEVLFLRKASANYYLLYTSSLISFFALAYMVYSFSAGYTTALLNYGVAAMGLCLFMKLIQTALIFSSQKMNYNVQSLFKATEKGIEQLLLYDQESLERELNDRRKNRIKIPTLVIIFSIFLHLGLFFVSFLFYSPDFNYFFITATAIFVVIFAEFLNLVRLLTIRIKIQDNAFQIWKEKTFEHWDLSLSQWEANQDDFLRYQTLSFDRLQLIHSYTLLLEQNEVGTQIQTYDDIKYFVDSFPDKKTLIDGLKKGYYIYPHYQEGESLGCPEAYSYNRVKKGKFLLHEEFLFAVERGFRSKAEMDDALARGCNYFTQYAELLTQNIETLDFNSYQKIRKLGFETYQEYQKANELGFENAKVTKLAQLNEVPNNHEFSEMIKFGMNFHESNNNTPLYILYKNALNSGFDSFKHYQEITERGFNSVQEYEEITKRGFTTKEEYLNATKNGFQTKIIWLTLTNLGFKNYEQFQLAESAGCKTLEEYEIINELGYTHWEDYQKGNEGGFTKSNEYYSAKDKGTNLYSVYKEIIVSGFSNYTELTQAKALGFVSKQQFDEAQIKGAYTAQILQELKQKGFDTYEEMELAQKHGFVFAIDYQEGLKSGASNFFMFTKMKNAGFKNFQEYQLAESGGFPSRESYQRGVKTYAKNYKELQILENAHLTRNKFIETKKEELQELEKAMQYYELAFDEAKEILTEKKDDFYKLKLAIDILQNTSEQVQLNRDEIDYYKDVFPELSEIFRTVKNKMQTLGDKITNYLTEKKSLYRILRKFLNIVKTYKVPSVVPSIFFEEILKENSLTIEVLKAYTEKYFGDAVSINLLEEVVYINKWIPTSTEQEDTQRTILEVISSRKPGKIIGIGKIMELTDYPGSTSQFIEQLGRILSENEKLATMNVDAGIIKIPDNDYFAVNYEFGELKAELKKVLENQVMPSKIPFKLSTVAEILGQPSPTPTFMRALKEVFNKFKLVSFHEGTGYLYPPKQKAENSCPVCFRVIRKGEKVGICTACSGQIHYNELTHWVLDRKNCPLCTEALDIKKVKAVVV